MAYDPDDPAMQITLTRVCRIITDPNSRRVIEILAGVHSMTLGELYERFDIGRDQLRISLKPMVELGLVRSRGRGYSFGVDGLGLLQSWIDFVVAGSGH